MPSNRCDWVTWTHTAKYSAFCQLPRLLIWSSDLYLPGQIADDTDVSTGATLRAPKVNSAIWDALGRRAYVIIK